MYNNIYVEFFLTDDLITNLEKIHKMLINIFSLPGKSMNHRYVFVDK